MLFLAGILNHSPRLFTPPRHTPLAARKIGSRLPFSYVPSTWFPPQGPARRRMSTSRSAAGPSQNGGVLPLLPSPRRTCSVAAAILEGFVPTSTFVPWEIVIGRSVFSRRVKQGTPRAVVSSWMPPESVKASVALLSRQRKSRYPSG